MSPAEACRERGWVPGDFLEGPDAFGSPARVRLTAVGARLVLAEDAGPPGARPPLYGAGKEDAWSVSWAEWRKA